MNNLGGFNFFSSVVVNTPNDPILKGNALFLQTKGRIHSSITVDRDGNIIDSHATIRTKEGENQISD